MGLVDPPSTKVLRGCIAAIRASAFASSSCFVFVVASVSTCRHQLLSGYLVSWRECQQWVGSVSPPRQKPVPHQGLDAINWRVPGIDGEAVTCVVDH